jgi:hypothetical protein
VIRQAEPAGAIARANAEGVAQEMASMSDNNNNYVFGRDYGRETIVNFHTDNGKSILQFKPDIASGDVVVTADAQGNLVLTIVGNKQVSIGGSIAADCCDGRQAVTVDLTTGVAARNGFGMTDRLVNSGAPNFYDYAGGTGKTTIITGASSNAAASDDLDFGPGISDEKLWLILSGNDLETDVMGKRNQMTVAGWFAGTRRQEVTAGGLAHDMRVSNLVKAMAAHAANTPGFEDATDPIIPGLISTR